MIRPSVLTLALLVASAPAFAQEPAAQGGRCATPDSVAIRGNTRISDATIRSDAGVRAGDQLNYRTLQRAITTLFATGNYDDIRVDCELRAGDKAVLAITVRERPILEGLEFSGFKRVSEKSATDSVNIPIGLAVDPSTVARVVARIDSLYEKAGYYLARVTVDSLPRGDGRIRLRFRVDEGRRLAVSGVVVDGNKRLSDGEIVAAMKTRPEGFWWFRRGEFDEDKYVGDLGERIPALYGKQGFIDFQVLHDTVIVDREHGKALLRISVEEGPQYNVGSFEPVGNRRFSTEEISQFYPFTGEGPTLRERARDIIRRTRRAPKNAFDRARWDDATQKLRNAYSNEGYIYAQIRPVVERRMIGADSTPTVDLRWEIEESRPAIVNRIEIQGNDYTAETCIRDQLVILPGDVFNQDRLIRSYQNISNLGFFEAPLPTPDTRTANDQGDIDVIFRVKEKRTGNINFGASMGGGNSVGGFIGLEQPNLFGQCKKGNLRWQFGTYLRDFELGFTDPAIRGSQISGSVSAYDSRRRYFVSGIRPRNIGGQVQFGFPVPRTPFARLFASYGVEVQQNDNTSNDPNIRASDFYSCSRCTRSTLGLTATRDTRIDMPFPTAGAMQTFTSQFNGGPLGGTANFQRYTAELFSYAPLGQLGGGRPGSAPVKFVIGLKLRGGAIFGDAGAFTFQKFALGGVTYGEPLRGYEEFMVTPSGVLAESDQSNATLSSFGDAFMTTTGEIGIRLNQQLYVNAFFEAGNVWNRPQDIGLRLKRSVGFGASLVTPIAPLGIDLGYGLDRVVLDANGIPRNKPQWKLHFKLGNVF
ncbi:MAG TPA: outer membrane protein assembly factor BamA [Gemmatimonadaceae bacterium]|nr:outer membrane protein assembly factor BamA [Gemmatimonadaceae bacterium]